MGYIGQFCWYDIMTTDTKASGDFFTSLFGWSTKDGHDGYTLLANGDAEFGGLMKQEQADHPSFWNAYVGVQNVNETVEKIKKTGGTVAVPGTDIANVGRFAVVSDPQGAWFSVYQGSDHQKDWSPRRTEAGDFEWSELATTDIPGAKGFYGENFGWAAGQVMPMDSGEYHMMMRGEEPACGVYSKPAEVPVCHWTHYIHVDDVPACIDKAKGLGGSLMFGPQTVPNMVTFAVLTDSTGAVFGISTKPTE